MCRCGANSPWPAVTGPAPLPGFSYTRRDQSSARAWPGGQTRCGKGRPAACVVRVGTGLGGPADRETEGRTRRSEAPKARPLEWSQQGSDEDRVRDAGGGQLGPRRAGLLPSPTSAAAMRLHWLGPRNLQSAVPLPAPRVARQRRTPAHFRCTPPRSVATPPVPAPRFLLLRL
jgi:hypothetical protein